MLPPQGHSQTTPSKERKGSLSSEKTKTATIFLRRMRTCLMRKMLIVGRHRIKKGRLKDWIIIVTGFGATGFCLQCQLCFLSRPVIYSLASFLIWERKVCTTFAQAHCFSPSSTLSPSVSGVDSTTLKLSACQTLKTRIQRRKSCSGNVRIILSTGGQPSSQSQEHVSKPEFTWRLCSLSKLQGVQASTSELRRLSGPSIHS